MIKCKKDFIGQVRQASVKYATLLFYEEFNGAGRICWICWIYFHPVFPDERLNTQFA